MRIKPLFILLVCGVFTLTAFSGVFAVCIKKNCDPRLNPDGCVQDALDYDDCLRQERAVKEVKERAEQERSGRAETDAPKGAGESKENSKYRFMEDVQELNKAERKYR